MKLINAIQLLAEAKKKHSTALTFDELQQQEVDQFNSSTGHLAGIECETCKNKGYIAEIEDGYVLRKECSCMAIRRSMDRIERSGLAKQLEKCDFAKYEAPEQWQKNIRDTAKDFVKEGVGSWFFIGGQVGCGKTFICTSIVGELLRKGLEAKYMLWRDEITSLKAKTMDDDYGFIIGKYKRIKVLYIDDFFKTESGKTPSTAEINIAFEILNYRYNNPDLITVISSEKCIDELLDIDEAVGSRIFERSKQYSLSVRKDKSKNFRLRGVK